MRGKAEPRITTIEVPPLSIRAAVGSVDPEARTVELIFSTGAPVERMDYWTGKRYIEKLSMAPGHVRLDRLNSGAPLLDAHSAWSIGDVFGTVESDSARIEKGKGVATVRFSKRDAVEPVWQDVRDGIIRSVSVGYKVHRFEETTPKDGAIPTRLATDWEPYEVSLVPMPADTGARVRGEERRDTNPCVIVTRADGDTQMAEDREQSESIAEDPIGQARQDANGQRLALDPPHEPTDRDRGATVERERVQGIMQACKAARVTRGFEEELISSGITLVEAQRKVFGELEKRGADDVGPRRGPQVRMTGEDPLVHVRKGVENALLHRVSPSMFKLEDIGRDYRGMTLIDTARAYLNANGIRTTSMSKMEIAGTALGLNQRGGYHTTSDFSDLIGDVISKTLLRAYDEAPQTFKTFSRQISASDFKDIALLNMGEAPALEEVVEHGEFTRGTMTTSKEEFRLKTYGRIFAVTRQVLVNDDVDAFSRVPTMFGRAARRLESDKVWAQITSNPLMSDGFALFSTQHGNLAADGDVISIASLSRARTAIRLQTSLDGSRLNLTPKGLFVPPSLETVAQQYVGMVTPQLMAAVPANMNPFQGLLMVVAESRLEDDSVTAWYVIASPEQMDVLVYAFLEGETGPTIERRVGFDVDGLEIKARHDFAAKVVDWRGIYKDPGEDVS